MNKKSEILLRAYFGYFLVLCLAAAILGRAFYVQTVQGDHYLKLAEEMTIYPQEIQAERGNIYSADGRLIATTLPVFELRFDSKPTYAHPDVYNENISEFCERLAEMFPQKTARQYKAEFQQARNKKVQYHLVRRQLTWAQLAEMKSWPFMNAGQFKSGLIAIQQDKRLMPFGNLARRTIGYVNQGGTRVGLEGTFDKVLQGEKSMVMIRRISGGAGVPIDSREEITPRPGKDVYTTIDINLQDVAEDALRRALHYHEAEHGTVVLMEVKTGRIRAMANLRRTADTVYEELQNFAVGEATYPGSTFKAATFAALFEDGFVNKNTLVNLENGAKTFYNRTIKDHDRPDTNLVSIQKAFEQSSNVAVAKLAQQFYGNKKQKFYEHLRRFGFTEPVSIAVPGASKPLLRKPSSWSGVSVPYMAHGYEMRLTPLHILQFYNAVANSGVMVAPTLLDKVTEYGSVVDSPGIRVVSDNLLKPETVNQLRAMMEGVVSRGTAINLYTDYLHIAGKTGTAVLAQAQANGSKVYQASFCGYFPAEQPRYSMIVVVNSPGTNGYYGNKVAGSIFKEVADKIYSLSLEMHPAVNSPGARFHLPRLTTDAAAARQIYQALGGKIPSSASGLVIVEPQGRKGKLQTISTAPRTLPDLRGMGLKDALYLLENQGLNVRLQGSGLIRSQNPPAGTRVGRGQEVTLLLDI